MTHPSVASPVVFTEPPLSRATQLVVAACLAAGALLIAVPQYVEHVLAGDLERQDRIAWGLAHQDFYRVEWLTAMVGGFALLIGFLGLWQITRWSSPRLTAVGAVVLTWGMSGQIFSDTATYVAQVVAADVFGAADAEILIADGYLHDPGMIVGVLVPVIAGMFVGVLLLAVALWRSALPTRAGRAARALAAVGLLRPGAARTVHQRAVPAGRRSLARGGGGAAAAEPAGSGATPSRGFVRPARDTGGQCRPPSRGTPRSTRCCSRSRARWSRWPCRAIPSGG